MGGPTHTVLTPAPPARPVDVLKLLAHEHRWKILEQLAKSDRTVNELVESLHKPANLVSYHLGKLRRAGVVRERRSQADARGVYYNLEMQCLHDLLVGVGDALHPAICGPKKITHPATKAPMAQVLFVCTGKSNCSEMAAALCSTLSHGLIEAECACLERGAPDPVALEVIEKLRPHAYRQPARQLSDVRGERFDYVVSVCDIARDYGADFPSAELIHWSLPEPDRLERNEARRAFHEMARDLSSRVRYLIWRIARDRSSDQPSSRNPTGRRG